MAINVIGYSERGMISAICSDIGRSRKPLALLESLIRLIDFPQQKGGSPFADVAEAEILIEQSFSTFGTPDLVILLRMKNDDRHAILIEAKVHTDVRLGREISQRWEFFQNRIDGEDKPRPSGLFTQMYRSHRPIQRLREGKDNVTRTKFFGGTKLGSNRVVIRAAEKVATYIEKGGFGWVVALLPESPQSVKAFFKKELREFEPVAESLPDWDIRNWGFVTWEQIDALCETNRTEWTQTLTAFDWNHEQIYVGRRERNLEANGG